MRSRPPLAIVFSLILVPFAALGGWWGVTWFRESPLREVRTALRAGRHLEAAGIAEGWLANHPGDQRALLAAARAYAHLGRWDLAEAYFALVPLRELDDLHLRARGLVMRQLHDKAADVFEQILQRWPMDGESLQRLAAIRGQDMRLQEALVFARRLRQVPSHRVVGHVLTGMLEMQARDPARAVESFETALELSPQLEESPTKPSEVLPKLAEALLLLGRVSDAERYALQARELTTEPVPCWILGQVRQQQGDEEGARRYWEETAARDPAFGAALRELGRLALLRQQPDEALLWLLRAHEASPTDNGTVQALAATYRLLGREDDAVELLAKNPPGSFAQEPREAREARQ